MHRTTTSSHSRNPLLQVALIPDAPLQAANPELSAPVEEAVKVLQAEIDLVKSQNEELSGFSEAALQQAERLKVENEALKAEAEKLKAANEAAVTEGCALPLFMSTLDNQSMKSSRQHISVSISICITARR